MPTGRQEEWRFTSLRSSAKATTSGQRQHEQGIIFRFGKVLGRPRGAGLTLIRPVGDRMQKVNMQIVAMTVPAQDGITKDNVTVRVDAVVYFRVVDPIKATINVQNYMFAISQQAQTSLRSIIGQSEMDQLLSERDTVNRELRRIIDEPTEGPWGIRVERVEIKDVSLLAVNPGDDLTAAHPNSNWIFRGYSPGRHIDASHLRNRLRHVFSTRASRLGTLHELTKLAPVAILAEALGYHPTTIERHAVDSATAYSRYVAAVRSG